MRRVGAQGAIGVQQRALLDAASLCGLLLAIEQGPLLRECLVSVLADEAPDHTVGRHGPG